MDATSSLERLAQRALRYCVNLDGSVDRHEARVLCGGQARVYEGTLRPKGIKVAVKTIRFGAPESDAIIERVLREVHLWSKLRHENIVPLLGIVTQFDFTISIVSEWMHRGNAFQHVQNTDVDPRPLLKGVARGLNYLHSRHPHPVYHGDLKGLNIMISNDGHALLTDFGLSYIVNSSFSLQVGDLNGGTLNWMAPEVLDGAKISPGSDIWAFGMTMLELFTRQRPFNEIQNLGALLARILRGPPDRPCDESTCSRLRDDWWDLCTSCWQREPLNRPKILYIIQKIDQMMELPRSSEPAVSGASASEFCGGNVLSPFVTPVLPGPVSGASTLDMPMDIPEPPVTPANDCDVPVSVANRCFDETEVILNERNPLINSPCLSDMSAVSGLLPLDVPSKPPSSEGNIVGDVAPSFLSQIPTGSMTRSISPDILPICESGTSTNLPTLPEGVFQSPQRRSSTRRVAFNTNYGERVFGDYTTGLIRQSHQENASIGERDIIIAVVGPTGSGKSTFVDRAVGLPDTSVGHQLSSCTREVRAVRYSNGARNIVLVDTPGFRHDSLSNAQVLQGTVDWMKNYNSDTKFDGLLYLHRISDNRWWIGAPLDQLGKLCEGEFKNIAFVTTMWDEVPEDVGLRREEELQNTFWQRMVKLGSTTHRFTGSEGSAWEIIRAISERISSRKTSAGEAVLDSYTSSSLVPKRSFRRNDKHPNSKKDQINRAAQRHTLQMIPSSAGVTMLDVAIDGSIWTGCTRTIRSGICSERGYGGALTGAITTLKLARSVAEFLQIACLQDAIVPSLSIALSIEATAGTHHALFQVVGTAGILIGVISDHAQKSRLTPEMMTAISVFAKELGRVQGVVQSAERKNPSVRDTLRDVDSRAISFYANSIRGACDAIEPMLSVENRQALQRIDTGLVAMMRALQVDRCRCGVVRKAMKQATL